MEEVDKFKYFGKISDDGVIGEELVYRLLEERKV